MPIDYSVLALSKGLPLAAVTEQRRATRQTLDERESDKVRTRSKGQCEIWHRGRRCVRRAMHVHHMEGGYGVRGRGDSARADRKQHACTECHSLITSKRLVRLGTATPHYTDRYRRVRAPKGAVA